MATADELLAGSTSQAEQVLTIDWESRTINIPKTITNLGVEYDDDTKHLTFRAPKHYHGTDLTKFRVAVGYWNADDEPDVYYPKEVASDDSTMTFTWVVGPHAYTKAGNVEFIVYAYQGNPEDDDADNKRVGTTLHALPVLKGGNPSEAVVEQHYDALVAAALESLKIAQDTFLKGDPGYTPVKGVDYFTEEERNEFAGQVIQDLNGTAIGSVIRVDDVSPVEHTVKARVRGKNLANPAAFQISKSISGAGPGSTINIIDNTTMATNPRIAVSENTKYIFTLDNTDYFLDRMCELDAYGVCTFNHAFYFTPDTSDFSKRIWTTQPTTAHIAVRLKNKNGTTPTLEELEAINLMITEYVDEDSGTYEPYIDPTGVTVTVTGKNVLPWPYLDGNNRVHNGVTYTVGDSGVIFANGKATDYSYIKLMDIDISDLPYTETGCHFDDNNNIAFASVSSGQSVNKLVWPQIELGTEATKYEKPIGHTTYTPDAHGYVDIVSVPGTMSIWTNAPGVTITAEYSRDIGGLNTVIGDVKKMIKQPGYANVKDYGAVGDGVTYDTAAINKCLAENSHVYIPSGTYLIDAGTSLIMHSNQVLELADSAVIKATIPDETKYYYAITIKGQTDVVIRGGRICGDMTDYPDSTAERGYGIYIYNSRNVRVDSCTLSDFRGDNIIIESLGETNYDDIVCANIRIERCRIYMALRHGITVMGVRGLVVKDTELYDTTGKVYSCAIDAETHYEWQEMSDFHYENVRAYNCNTGVLFNQNSWAGAIRNATIDNCSFDRIQFSMTGEVNVNRSDIRIISVARYIETFVANHCNLGKCYMGNNYEVVEPRKVIINNCVFDCTEDNPDALAFESGTGASTVEFEANNCVFNSYVSDVRDTSKLMFQLQSRPVQFVLNNCILNINNPNPTNISATGFAKAYNCIFKYNFNQEGYPSSLLTCFGEENYVVGNVFDTTRAKATNNDKAVIDCVYGDLWFTNNVGVMTEKYGVTLTYAGSATGRTWTMLNNIFRQYPDKGTVSEGVTYIDIGNIYSSTT